MILELDTVTVAFTVGPPLRRRRLEAMKEVSLHVAAGETLGVVGESGSGKTTTSRVVLGLQRPTSGTVRFDGALFPKRRALAGRMQAVLQHPQWSLNPRMRVGQSVAEPLVVLGDGPGTTGAPGKSGPAGKAEAADRAADMLEQVGLERSFADRYPHELSGGQRQRVSIARALVTRPDFLVFDEAVSALDVSVQVQILNLIKDLQAEFGFGALFISHDLGAVRYVADRIAVMRAGQVVETADTEVFYQGPSHPYSQQLLEAL